MSLKKLYIYSLVSNSHLHVDVNLLFSIAVDDGPILDDEPVLGAL